MSYKEDVDGNNSFGFSLVFFSFSSSFSIMRFSARIILLGKLISTSKSFLLIHFNECLFRIQYLSNSGARRSRFRSCHIGRSH